MKTASARTPTMTLTCQAVWPSSGSPVRAGLGLGWTRVSAPPLMITSVSPKFGLTLPDLPAVRPIFGRIR